MKFYTHEEMLDRHIGKKGTFERDNFDAEVEAALIGATIKEARKASHLTQSQLGERVGVGAAQISKIESGRNLTISTIVKVLRALDLTAEFSFNGLGLKPIVLGALR
ncbi:MAG: helix-turn-helix domain-containing protein [Duncaniella sp.]|nr:helix-turn-helix domain-containing protein [Duncaniella sp.]